MNNKEENLFKLIKICHSNLRNSKECMDYLKDQRKIPAEYVSKYKIGYFPKSINTLTNYVDKDVLKDLTIVNMFMESDFQKYFYLIFPIYSEYGDPVAIAGRTLADDNQRNVLGLEKYKNSSYKKTNYLYGLNLSKEDIVKERNVFVTEGYFDQISLSSNGVNNSVAICGTAFTRMHFLKLSRYTDKISFILDSDEAGKKASLSAFSKYSNKGIKLRFYNLPDGVKDIDEYFRLGGSRANLLKDLKLFIPEWQ